MISCKVFKTGVLEQNMEHLKKNVNFYCTEAVIPSTGAYHKRV